MKYFGKFLIAVLFLIQMVHLSIGNSFAESGSKAGDRNQLKFAAIAYSEKTGAYGYASNKKDKRTARRVAKRECRKHARDCKHVTWTRLACLSLATDPGGGWGADYGKSRNIAIKKALKGCRKHKNNTNCSTLVTICQ